MNYAQGSSGDDVKTIQTALIASGYSVGTAGIDGIFGPDTEAAVKQFQTDHGLTVDGIVGPETATAMNIFGLGSTPSAPPTQPSSGVTLLKWGAVGGAAYYFWKKFF